MRGSARAGTVGLGLICAAVVAILLFAAPAQASKTHLFLETFGSVEQPQFGGGVGVGGTNGLAFDQASGDLLVIDPAKDAIGRYRPDGTPDPFSALGSNEIDAKKGPGGKACAEEAASCDQTPQNGFGFGGFAAEQQVAVDDSGTLTDGDVYVAEFEKYVSVFAADGHYLGQLADAGGTSFKDKICGVAVDPGGALFLAERSPLEVEPNVFVAQTKIHKFEPSANPPLGTDHVATFTVPDSVCSLAAGASSSAGALFAGGFFDSSGNNVYKLNAGSGASEGVISTGPQAGVVLGLDPLGGHLFKAGVGQVAASVEELTASGSSVAAFGITTPGIAIGGGRIYLASANEVKVYDAALSRLPDVSTGSYEVSGDAALRLKGTVNPDGEALTGCFFEYGPTASYGQLAPCEAPDAAEVGAGSAPVEVHAEIGGLAAESEYHYRLLAKNANAALYPADPSTTVKGADKLAKTPTKPAVKDIWATEVTFTEATLKAKVNPGNSPTTYRFEWGPDTSYGASSPELALGSDDADHTVGFTVSGLQPGSTYHYRLLAANGIGESESADRQIATFANPEGPSEACENKALRSGASTLLPDCRAYEMVSPVDKGGGDIRVGETTTAAPAVLEQAVDSGEKLAYGSFRAFFGDAESAPFTSQYIARRVAGLEWQTHAIDPPRGRTIFKPINQLDTELRALSPDLCQGWFTTFAELAAPEPAGFLAGYSNLLRRNDQLCGAGAADRFEALAPLATPATLLGPQFTMVVIDVSADGEHATFMANDRLLPEGEGGGQLYESVRGEGLRFPCVLPDGAPVSGPCTAGSATLGGHPGPQSGRLSADGRRIFWSDSVGGEADLYLRQNPDQPESARLHGAASGKGDLIGPAAGSGNVVAGEALLKKVKTTSGGFVVGQEVSDSNGGIPAETTIEACSPDCAAPTELTLSAKATKTKFGDALSGAASATVPGIVTETGAFEAGQEISAPAIPPGATVLFCSPGCGAEATSLTLSAKATKTQAGAHLSATSPCTEAATKACTIAVSAAGEEASGTSHSWFWGASADGSRAIFSTAKAEAGISDLYEFHPDGEATQKIAGGVIGVIGISEDASRIYFASTKVLSEAPNSNGEKAEAGENNLYLRDGEGGIEFVARLAGADLTQALSPNVGYSDHTARVTPDGLHAAFISVAPLAGYDNTGAGTACEGPCREVYLYDAAADRLICASCNPSGARPAGHASLPAFQNPRYGARALSEDGSRLYFETTDALTPRDTNAKVDVYQWEEPGAGPAGAKCTPASPTYSPQNEGCVDLLSTGLSRQDSRFVEADPSGDNVFFATGTSLLPQDPGLIDIYDARVGGGLPVPAPPGGGCEGEACQGAPEAPNDPTPASESFQGAGNVLEAAPTGKKKAGRCAKGKVKRRGRCVRKHRARHHRGAGR